MSKREEDRIFEEACNGYGFEEIEQTINGVYCEGCCTVHKRPTKMYRSSFTTIKVVCRHAMVQFFNPEDC